MVVASAGGAIPGLQAQAAAGGASPMGHVDPATVDAVVKAFEQGTGVAVLVATLMLALGLLGALKVARVDRQLADEPAPTA